MKRLLFLFYLSAMVLAGAANGKEPVVVASGEFPPWNGAALPHGGFVNHALTRAYEEMGYAVTIKYWPWKRANEMALTDPNVHLTSFWYCTEERAKDFHCSDAIGGERYVFFHLKDRVFDWKTEADLAGLRVGATRSIAYTEDFWRLGKEGVYAIDEAASDEQNFSKLLLGRVHVFPMAMDVGYELLREKFPDQASLVTHHDKTLVEQTGHLLYSRANPRSAELLKAFNEGLAKLKATGEYDQMIAALLSGGYR